MIDFDFLLGIFLGSLTVFFIDSFTMYDMAMTVADACPSPAQFLDPFPDP